MSKQELINKSKLLTMCESILIERNSNKIQEKYSEAIRYQSSTKTMILDGKKYLIKA